MNILTVILAFAGAYLAGSIPSAVWIGRIFHKIDVREHGSGNAGATNTIRVLGWKTGIPVLLIDLAKGCFATMLPVFLKCADPGSTVEINLKVIAGLIAISGHILPVFAGFKGGKGVATAFGVLFALQPWLTLTSIGVFLVIFLISGIVSIASMIAGLSFPVFLFTIFSAPSLVFKIFSILLAIAIIFTHRKNIKRLFRGEESKLIHLRKRREA
ncbi:MAG TPA: glycerol-3-phosphate 1-O-acyltransferase PlsY [Bacteroidales bacterium]|jgi:glycerol-3-phosphate acyltransferase PlsY|nr:glycerol-3-phosphate 1-O-acyltransferase PlsY [Bacteroidales bacterium]